jgi:GNAT superfamily N-acetyltransferase
VGDKTTQNSCFHIRLACQNDILYIANILANSFYFENPESFMALPKWFHAFVCWSISLDLRIRLLDISHNYACFVAEHNVLKQAIATLELSLKNIPNNKSGVSLFNWNTSLYPYVANLAVHPQWRRQGVAAELLKSVEQTAIKWGFRQIYLHVLENNQPARRLYQSLGYQLYKVDSEFSIWQIGKPRRLLLKKLL